MFYSYRTCSHSWKENVKIFEKFHYNSSKILISHIDLTTTTIKILKDFLKDYSERQFRVFCLLFKYNSPVDFGSEQIQEAVQIEKRFTNFIQNISSTPILDFSDKISPKDLDFMNWLLKQQQSIMEFLSDDFDTPKVIDTLLQITSRYYNDSKLHPLTLSMILSIYTDSLSTLGVEFQVTLTFFEKKKKTNINI